MALKVDDEPADPLGSAQNVFHYLPAYQVLICKPCGYAVQPGAITRHLKDIHHLYRHKKKPYVEYASTFTLKPPGEVELPPPGQKALPHLTVEKGWACTAPGCGHLCVSTKRMEAHWSADHGRKGIRNGDYESCTLQTLFRGNWLRYFQVTRGGPSAAEKETVSPEREIDQVSGRNTVYSELQERHALDASDVAALQQYYHRTHKSFVASEESEPIWLEVVPCLARDNPFLLHGILACSYLEMAYLQPDRRELYALRACSHQDRALPLFHDALANATAQNVDAIIVFSYFLVVYSLATDEGSVNHSLLIINDGNEKAGDAPKPQVAIPHWLYFIRVGCSHFDHLVKRIEEGPVSKLALAWESAMDAVEGPFPHLDRLLQVIPDGDSSWTEEHVATYRQAADTLARSLAHTERVAARSDLSTWSVLSIWPVCVGDGYYEMLYERHPGALILLAHYCIILKQIQSKWYFDQGAMRLMTSIIDLLDTRWHPYIEEPAKIVLGSLSNW